LSTGRDTTRVFNLAKARKITRVTVFLSRAPAGEIGQWAIAGLKTKRDASGRLDLRVETFPRGKRFDNISKRKITFILLDARFGASPQAFLILRGPNRLYGIRELAVVEDTSAQDSIAEFCALLYEWIQQIICRIIG